MYLEDFGKAVGHKSRAAILLALIGGKALPASELAYRAKISNQTASSHLAILEDLNMIFVRQCGRHRYYELVDHDIADAIEALASKLKLGLRDEKVSDHLRYARFCYDHLAGVLGVSITIRLLEKGVLGADTDTFKVVDSQHSVFEKLEIDLECLGRKRRLLAPKCIDWSERVPHVAGSLGAAIAVSLEKQKMIERSKEDRSVKITRKGYIFLERELNISREILNNQ
ncbi:ArsR/SmtB family transcription factor [Palleronia caenipelagi]|uniref:Winged helix-turn-helix transcriptional regulator n=1 Tax=Palleronia caenipelagi TaxID=2489174 RepID=A0A547PJ73_9RHOB|nr:helix-turn-helix domain-containing protein [Palleronia caenipelagi]TRD14163.1 winged helix-turn-helix transcriptional regulator [Palleronia caenipelagi]